MNIRRLIPSVLFVLSLLVPFFIAVRSIYLGGIPFWHDPARDFLLAVEHLKKPTLIGPPSGIAGIFYGPYWIWFISLMLIVTKDPRIVVFFLLTIPYFVIFPFILFHFRKIFSPRTCFFLWIFFIFSYMNYATYLWNPHISSLLYLLLVFLVVFLPHACDTRRDCVRYFLVGCMIGLILNFHIPLGIGTFLATFGYVLLSDTYSFFRTKKNRVAILLSVTRKEGFVFFGILLLLFPFFLFEFRHGFHQIDAGTVLIRQGLFSRESGMTLVGIDKRHISEMFFRGYEKLLFLPHAASQLIFLFFLSFFVLGVIIRGISFSVFEKRLAIYLFLSFLTFFLLFVLSPIPVWEYHFNGLEIIFLLFFGLLLKKIRLIRVLSSIWIFVFVFFHLRGFVANYSIDPFSLSSLGTKQFVVATVFSDAGDSPFSFFAYSPGIYTYDYDYLFYWLSDVYHRKPEVNTDSARYIYLIIPSTSNDIREDFIHYRTPDAQYTTGRTWNIADGTLLVRREKIQLEDMQ